MRIWILTPFEPLPTEGDVRLMRVGQLAAELARREHDVTWWTPDFEHYSKRHRTGGDATQVVAPNYRIRLVASLGYRRHVGPRRLRHNRRVAARWRRLAEQEKQAPDLIFSAWPTPDASAAALAYAEGHDVPLVVDVRDLWPDLWLGVAPRPLRPMARLVLQPYYGMARRVFGRATAITGVTPEYVAWATKLGRRAPAEEDRPFALGFRPPLMDAEARDAARARLGAHGYRADGRISVVFAGTFSRSFDFDTVLAAAARSDPARVRFVLCGSGERWESVHARAGDLPGVLVLPRIAQAELMTLYGDAACGLAPYVDIENFRSNVPNKIHEYLAAGLPIVSPVGGRIQTLLSQHGVGLTYAPRDASALTAAVQRILDADTRASLKARVQAFLAARPEVGHPAAPLADHLEHIATARA